MSYVKGRHATHTACGVLLHSSLAVTTDGLPLGLAAAKFWSRRAFKGTNAARRTVNPTTVPIEDKESVRWLDNLVEATGQLGDPGRCVHVGDREADIFELFHAAHVARTHVLVRTKVDRLAGRGRTTVAKVVKRRPVRGEHTVAVRDAHGRPATAVVRVRFCRVVVHPSPAKRKRYGPLALTAIWAVERGRPADREPIRWKLLTDLPVDDLAAAIEKRDWYAMRWTIEVFHKILKSGCRAEQAKLRTTARLSNLLALLCVVGCTKGRARAGWSGSGRGGVRSTRCSATRSPPGRMPTAGARSIRPGGCPARRSPAAGRPRRTSGCACGRTRCRPTSRGTRTRRTGGWRPGTSAGRSGRRGSRRHGGTASSGAGGAARRWRRGTPMAARHADGGAARRWRRGTPMAAANPRSACDAEHHEYGGPRCQSVVAADPDRRIGSLVLEAVEPAARELSARAAAAPYARKPRLERAGYEADRARRPYDAVDPANRPVARDRERPWEQKRADRPRWDEEYARFRSEPPRHRTAGDRDRIGARAADRPGLWHGRTTTGGDRRAIVRLRIERVALTRHGETERIDGAIHRRGEVVTRREVRQGLRPHRSHGRLADLRPRVLALRGGGQTADAIAGVRNREGYHAARGEGFTGDHVRQLLVGSVKRVSRPACGTRATSRGPASAGCRSWRSGWG